ncbi:MAG: helix-turn-helix transcriptional regulator [Lewinellaceae bacterium]|nr:helix-turn-helix transcriptional regulator [Lewinellaceae bacterium]
MEAYEVHELIIKNMICSRCLKVARQNLEALGIEVLEMRLGRVKFRFPKGKVSFSQIEEILMEDEFEFAKSKDEQLSETIKLALIEMINSLPVSRDKKLSEILVEKLHKDYWSLSKAFSKTEGITIEKYFILLRIEKVKELIEYDELNFSEIAYELGYNNIYHLSGQFKQVTGMSMSEYKLLKDKPRSPLDNIL